VLRVGLALGSGGSIGIAYHGGVLAALAEATGWDPRSAEVILGTSAGAITGAMLRAGLSATDLASVSEQRPLSAEAASVFALGQPMPHRPPTSFALPRLPRAGAALGALAQAVRRPWGPFNYAAFLPEGVISTQPIAEGFDRLFAGGWPARPLWLCAVRLDDGQRVVFGRPGEETAPVGQAVGASCAIPAHFAPVTIGGHRFIDGGARSMTNLDVLAPLDLDLVLVSAPLAGVPALRPDVLVRQALRAQLDTEAHQLRRRGTPVVVFEPERADLGAMGLNPLDVGRRSAVSTQARASTLARVASGDLESLAPLGRSDAA
jgi:NTE family protein